MKIKKQYKFIDIQTEDKSKLTEIAYLVDNLGFVEEIENARKKFNLTFSYPLSEVDEEIIHNKFEQRLYLDEKFNKEFFDEVERIRKLFRMPPHFKVVIEVSILYGKVREHNYSKAYLEEQNITPIKSPDEIPDIKYSIVIHSGTRIDDIEKAFEKFKEKIKINYHSSEEEKRKYNFGYWFDFSLTKPIDSKNTISDLRTLYHKRMNGQTPMNIALEQCKTTKEEYKKAQKICDKEMNNLSVEEFEKYDNFTQKIEKKRDIIKTLIKRYRSFLQSPNTLL